MLNLYLDAQYFNLEDNTEKFYGGVFLENNYPFRHIVNSVTELREITGDAGKLAKSKVISHLDQHSVDFISNSPFLVLSSVNEDGACDASPRGDQPGFVHIIDSYRLIIPERRGNKRLDSIQNILTQPTVGLLFIIPGLGETLRQTFEIVGA